MKSTRPIPASPKLSFGHQVALQPLEQKIGYLGAARQTLENLKKQRGSLSASYFKRGNEKHHTKLAKALDSNSLSHIKAQGIPIHEIKEAHIALASRIKEVREAHNALMEKNSQLAWKDGKLGAKNRKYKTPSGQTQSLGNYHGKRVTKDGTPKTFNGGRKRLKKRTRKHKRKHKKRKTSKHKKRTRKHTKRHKRKTKRR